MLTSNAKQLIAVGRKALSKQSQAMHCNSTPQQRVCCNCSEHPAAILLYRPLLATQLVKAPAKAPRPFRCADFCTRQSTSEQLDQLNQLALEHTCPPFSCAAGVRWPMRKKRISCTQYVHAPGTARGELASCDKPSCGCSPLRGSNHNPLSSSLTH